jgi:glycosyltransferase involved in cell wall biosynthesis
MPRWPAKIMYLADAYETRHAGTESQLFHLVGGLDSSRFVPHMTVLRPSAFLRYKGFPCPVEVLHVYKMARASTGWKLWRYARRLRQSGFRLVHIFFNDASTVAPPFLKLAGLKVIVSRRDMGIWYRPSTLGVVRFADRFVDRVVANSEAVKRHVHQNERVPLERVTVIRNGYPALALSPPTPNAKTLGFPSDAPVVGIVANLRPIKRIQDLIEAFALVTKEHPGTHLVIVGADKRNAAGQSVREALEGLARSLGIWKSVHFTGRVKDVAPLVKRFAVGVLCSESEGFSNALVEYMQSGVPTVCTDTGGNPELITEGETGFLVPVGDVQALAERIAAVLSDGSLRTKLGCTAQRVVQRRFGLDSMLREQSRVYEEVLNPK